MRAVVSKAITLYEAIVLTAGSKRSPTL